MNPSVRTKRGNQINLLDIAADEEVDVVEKMEECENIRKLWISAVRY